MVRVGFFLRTICAMCRAVFMTGHSKWIANVHRPTIQTIRLLAMQTLCIFVISLCPYPKGCMYTNYCHCQPQFSIILWGFACTLYNISGRCIRFVTLHKNVVCGSKWKTVLNTCHFVWHNYLRYLLHVIWLKNITEFKARMLHAFEEVFFFVENFNDVLTHYKYCLTSRLDTFIELTHYSNRKLFRNRMLGTNSFPFSSADR